MALGLPDWVTEKPHRQEVAGPYRSESTVPSIRRQATRHEHRRVYNPFDHVATSPALNTQPGATPHAAPVIPLLAGVTPSLASQGAVDYPDSPYTALRAAALKGQQPDAALRQEWPKGAFDQITKVALEKLASQEGISADPIAEALIATGATAGIGGIAGLLRGGAGAAAAAAGEESAPSLVRGLGAGARSAIGAPGRARSVAEEFAAAQGERVAGRAGATVGRQAVQHPAVTAAALGALANKADIPIPGADVAGALVGGTLDAIANNPGGTAATTGRALAGSVASLAGLGYSAGKSAVELDPAPFLNTAGTQLQGLEDIGGKLLSGDQGVVQKATEDEAGLSFLAPLPAIRRFKGVDVPGVGRIPGYEEVRSVARDKAKGVRAATAERYGLPLRHGLGEQNIFAFAERRGQRRAVAEMGQRESVADTLRGAKEGAAVEKAARDLPGARSLRNIHGIQGGDVIQTIADYGLNHPDQLRLLDERGPTRGGTIAGDAAKGDVNLAAVVAHLKENPELLTNPKVRAAVDAYRTGAKKTPLAEAGEGLRASRLSQAALLGVRDAVERIPAGAEKFLPKKEGGWSRQDAWDFAQLQHTGLTKLRASARKAEADAQVLAAELHQREIHERVRQRRAGAEKVQTSTPARTDLPLSGREVLRPARKGDGSLRLEETSALAKGKAQLAHLQADARGKRAAAKQLERELKGLTGELKPFTRPEHAVSSRARRKLWDEDMVAAMVKETDAAGAKHGLDPGAYTHHGELASSAEKASSPRGGNIRATGVQHVRRSPEDPISLAARDSVARDLGSLIEGSIEAPRRRAGLQKFGRKFFASKHIQLKVTRGGGEVSKGRVTFPEFNKAVRDGQIGKQYVWVPESEYKQPFNVKQEALDPAEKGVASEILETGGKGSYGLVVPKEAHKEYVAQTNPQQWLGEQFANAVSKGAGRVLLFSPAWVASQAIAEALPAIMAHPRLALDPRYAAKLQRRLKASADIDKDAAVGFAAVMGESPVRAATPREIQPGFSPTHSMFHDGARAIEHTKVGRAVFSTARLRPLVVFDQWRQGKYRQILAAAEVDKQLNGFMHGLQGAVRNQKKISDELKGLPPERQLHEVQANPRYRKMLDETAKYVEDIQGNWTAFTRYERAFAPFAIFYGFIRYAFRWPLTFATRHPMSASINYFLAQQNANQIEKLLHGKPAAFYQYGNPVVQDAQGKSDWLPGGSRISPGLSAPAQGVLGGSGPAAAVGSLNPAYQSINALINGTTGFGTHDENEGLLGFHWSLAAKTLLSTPPILRLLGVGRSESDTAKQLRELDPNRSLRSFALPFLPQGGGDARQSNEIISALEREFQGDSSSSSSATANPFDSIQIGGGSGGGANAFDKVLP